MLPCAHADWPSLCRLARLSPVQPPQATSNTALLAAGGVEPGPGVKMRRLEGGAEVIYRPLAPAGAPSTAAAEGGQPLAASRHGSASHLEGLGGGEGGAASGATQ